MDKDKVYSFKEVKSLAGQGAIYIKPKDGFSLLIDNGRSHGDSENDQTMNITYSNDGRTVLPTEPTEIKQARGNEYLNTTAEVKINDLETVTAECVSTCKKRNLNNPVEILKCAQKFILQGRPLEVTSLSEPLDGETNFVCID